MDYAPGHVSWSSLETVNANWTLGAGFRGSGGRAQLLLEILMVLMCLGAVTGNILVIAIVAATKTFHSVTSVLVMNLAISDLLVAVGVMPFVALSIMNHGWVDCNDLCLYVGYTSSVYCTASVLTLAAIALDRYHSIVDCLRYSSRCTLWRTSGVVLWIWLQALATSCPPLLGWGSISYVAPMYSCAVNWASNPGYTTFMAALCYLIPAVVILFCYVNIVKVARRHARRIHTLEVSVQRSRSEPPDRSRGTLHGPSKLVYHVSGHFSEVSEVGGGEEVDRMGRVLPGSTTEQQQQSGTTSDPFNPLTAQGDSQPSQEQNSQQQQQQPQHSHHGLLRLFLVISAFFLCWTPYIGVTLVQAAEAAISGQSSLVPPLAVTFSYWLVLLNSDINPLLYALLSKRFQGALQGLRQKIRARVGSVARRRGGRGVKTERDEDEERRTTSAPCTTNHPGPSPSSSEASTSSIVTVSADFKCYPGEQVCKGCHCANTRKACSAWQLVAGGERRSSDCLQVPSRPQEGGRLPFSALTRERQATFFYGQITVRVEHDVS